MPETKQDSPGSESKFAPENKFGAKKKRHLPDFTKRSIVNSVTAVLVARKKKRIRTIQNLDEALTMSAKGLYLRASKAENQEEREKYKEWARERTRWEYRVGIRKLPPKKSAAA